MAPPKQPHHSPECHTSSSLSAPNSYSIRFPQRSTQGHPLQDEPTASDAITIKGLRIVVADDDTFTTALIGDALRSHGRAAETMTNRMYTALGLENDDQTNLWVAAIRFWQQGRVTVR